MLVVADKTGQLGNRLFLFAHCVAAALDVGCRVANPSFDEYAAWFESTSQDLFARFPARRTRLRNRRLRRVVYTCARVSASLLWRMRLRRTPWWRVERLQWGERHELGSSDLLVDAGSKTVFLQGWLFRNNDGLSRHAHEIRAFFRPTPRIQAETDSFLTTARGRASTLVGVHVRQGDYRSHLSGRYYFEVETYRRLMAATRDLLGGEDVVFVLASDVPQDIAAFEGMPVIKAPGHPAVDIHVLAGCDWLIGPPSSFTLWASFAGETPLYVIADPGVMPDMDSFAVVPRILDPDVAELYAMETG